MTVLRILRHGAAAVAAGVLALGFATGAYADAPSGRPVDGINCDEAEGAVFHIHQHLALFDHGKPVPIPSDVGRPLTANCLYWIHTHTSDGLIHVESPSFRSFTLGNFFDVWGQPLGPIAAGPAHVKKGQLRVFVNGSAYAGDPRKIDLAQHTDVTIEAGPPFAKPVPFADWNGN